MAELKTQKNHANVNDFLNSIDHEQKRKDAIEVSKLMEKITKSKASMWGTSIVGFGSYHYTYASGREGDWFLSGFSPRKQSLTLYIMSGFSRYNEILNRLGKYKTGKSCLYINKLDDIDMKVLEELITESVAFLSRKK